MTDYIDVEELDNTYEADWVKGQGYQAVGYSLLCPRCLKHNSAWSALEDDWVCHECGLIFSRELSWIVFDMIHNDKEQKEEQQDE